MFPFDIKDSFTKDLPSDSIEKNYPRQVGNTAYSKVSPVTFENSKPIHVTDFYQELGLTEAFIESAGFQDLVTGQKLPKDVQSYAMAYAGHQFGHWAGQLGDGRALNLFEARIKNNVISHSCSVSMFSRSLTIEWSLLMVIPNLSVIIW